MTIDIDYNIGTDDFRNNHPHNTEDDTIPTSELIFNLSLFSVVSVNPLCWIYNPT